MDDKWTDEEVTELHAMLHSGKTNKQIANVLGRTKKAIEQKISRLGITRQRTGIAEESFLNWRNEFLAGKSIATLTKETGLSRGQLGTGWRKLGLTESRQAKITIRQLKAYYARHHAGERISALAHEAGMQPSTLRNWFKRTRCGPIRSDRGSVDCTQIHAVIKARAAGIKWQDIPAYIGSTKSENALRLQAFYRKKKSGS